MEELNQLNTKDIERLIDTWNNRIITLRILIVVFAAFFVSVCVYLYRLNKYTILVNTYIAKVDEFMTQLDNINDNSLMFDFVFEEDNYYV